MKKTALNSIHIEAGAKMVPFAGYEMPLQYSGLTDEHLNVRENLGVFDVSHMGEFFLKGEKALDLVQKVTSNDASKLIDGKIQYSCLPNGKGGIVDDLLVYRINAEEYMLVVNASNIEKDWNWIKSHNTFGVEMTNKSDEISLLAVQGPKAVEVLQKLTSVNLSEISYYSFVYGDFAGIENILISATGYTGAGGFEIYFENKHAETIWNAVMEAGKDFGIKPAGLAARDTLRLEMGFCLYGNDIDDTTSPLEAGLGWITKLSKDFIDSDYLKAQKESGLTKKLVGFELIDKGIPRHDYEIENEEGKTIGKVTSGTMSPSLKSAIGLGYVEKPYFAVDSEIFIVVRNKKLKAKVVKIPFLKS
jgi:aminomethyltransferase